MEKLIKNIKKIRSVITLKLKPKSGYFLFSVPKRSLKPLSTKWGYDRGTPIDRYYIEKFLNENKKMIRGKCLEVTDNFYTEKFGEKRIISSDVIDINKNNRKANIIADVRDLATIGNNSYNTIIATQLFGIIDEYQSAISELIRILKPNGTLLATVSSMGPVLNKNQYWRFTPEGAKYIFSKIFGEHSVTVKAWGNILSSQAFLVGLSTEEMSKKELETIDSRFPIIVSIIAIK